MSQALRLGLELYTERLASLKQFDSRGITQIEFDSILCELSDLRERKVIQRGEGRYKETDPKRSKLLLGADLHRKYQRLDRFLIDQQGGSEDIEDDFKDLANYSAMGLQLGRREGWFK